MESTEKAEYFHATAIVGMRAALPKDYRTESNNMFRNLSVMGLLPQNVIFQFANVNIPPSQQLKFNLSRMIRPLDFTSYAIPLALNTIMTACSPFSQKHVRHFIFQLLKPPSLKLPTLFSADKKNSFITKKFFMFPLNCKLTAHSFAVTPISYLPITARLLL